MMNKETLDYKIADVKAEFVRLQDDMEKLDSVNGNSGPIEKQLDRLQDELKALYQQRLDLDEE
ncbi:SE1832 family protein [Peribacillus psychrosaccharolyticus]|nr:SE1832 family protein [Peribacillus psychrosaccharolyticus]